MKFTGKFLRFLSSIIVFLILVAIPSYGQTSTDFSGHWAEKQISSFIAKGFATTYKDGSFKPNNNITRAEFAGIANKAFNLTEKELGNFKDVKLKDKYYNDMAIAKRAKYIVGFSDGTVKPKGYMTRQEFAVIITRLLKIDTKKDNSLVLNFNDVAQIPGWSKPAICVVTNFGYMKGDSKNLFNPTGFITRAEAIAVLERCYNDNTKIVYSKIGKYSPGKVDGSLRINVRDVTVENTVISGNLVIGEAVGDGEVRLKNVTVLGDTIVNGGGREQYLY